MMKDWTSSLFSSWISSNGQSKAGSNASTMTVNIVGNSTTSGAYQTETLVITNHVGSHAIFVFVSK